MSNKHYKCMIVKKIENNRLVTQHKLGEMYITLNENYEEAQKFFRSAENLKHAIKRAKELNQECIKFGLGCVVAEMKKSGSEHQLIIPQKAKPHVKNRPYKRETTDWLVYLAEDGNAYNVDKNHIIGSLCNQEP